MERRESTIPSRAKNFSFRLTALALSLLLAAGFIEICLRIFGPPYYRFNNLSQEYYTNPRGYHDVIRKEGRHTIYGLSYHENDYGNRISSDNDQLPIAVPGKQILGVGDSFTYGRGVRYEDIYLTRLEELLSQGNDRTAIKNCGVVGAGIGDIVEIYDRESDSLPRGSLVIYGLVLNDFGLDLTDPIKGLNFIDINNGGYTFSPLRKYSALINFIIHSIETRRLHTKTLRAYLESFEGENGQHGFDLLEQLNQSILDQDGSLLVVVFPLLYDFEEYPFLPMHQKVKSFCDRRNILYVDLLPVFSRHPAEDLWSNPTDHHPNDIAHELAADEIAAYVEDHVTGF